MRVFERSEKIKVGKKRKHLLSHLEKEVHKSLKADEKPIRLIVTHSNQETLHCELSLIQGAKEQWAKKLPSIFAFKKREIATHERFNAVLIVPTGIGAEIGGHAGDANPVAKLLGSVCDRLITHPNVVNASDINEMPTNALYVEGSTLCRLLMGEIGLNPVRANRILFIADEHADNYYFNNSVNSLNAAKATYGLNCPLIVKLSPPFEMSLSTTKSGRASGELNSMEILIEVLEKYKDQYDAVALSTVIDYPDALDKEYFHADGAMMNPWGGIEALLTHTISMLYPIPSAHSPMKTSEKADLYCREIKTTIEPRMAAEFVSMTYLQCILKGLHVSPQIIMDATAMLAPSVISAKDISCLVIPQGCLGLPVLAALEQGIVVIAVKENTNIMRNDLNLLPWKAGQYFEVENYLEAAGLMSAMKAGVCLESLKRPIHRTKLVVHR